MIQSAVHMLLELERTPGPLDPFSGDDDSTEWRLRPPERPSRSGSAELTPLERREVLGALRHQVEQAKSRAKGRS